MGTGWGEGSPAALLSIQVPVSSYVLLEGEATRRSHEFGYEVTTVAGHVLFTVRSNRVSTFAGGGLGMQRTTAEPVRYSIPYVCAPPDSASCQLLVFGRHSSVIAQALGGADVRFGSRLGAFVTLHAGTAPEHGIRLFGGMRVGLLMQQPAQRERAVSPGGAAGKEIRVTLANGGRQTGRLIELSDTEVAFLADTKAQPVVLSLTGVRKVETVSHHARTGALLGAGAGGFLIALAYSDGGCDDCGIFGFIFPAAFAGVGAAVGGMVNAATANRHVLYQTVSTSVSVQPTISSSATGVTVLVRW
jgi:hypothetical protein